MKRIYIVLVGLMMCSNLFSADRMVYMDRMFNETTENKAMYIRHIFHDSIDNHILVEDYSRAGNLFRKGSFSSLSPEIKDGKVEEYYSWGKMCYLSHYKNNELHGERKSFYTTGELKRTEEFNNGKLLGGKCFDKDGNEIEFYPSVKMPTFSHNDQTLTQFISGKVEYPFEAIMKNIEGTVWVSFDVTENGRVKNITIDKTDHVLLNASAKQVIKASSNKWTQGQYEGQMATINMTVPIRYSLEN